MLAGKYRLTGATISILEKEGRRVADMIPAGAIITVPLGTNINGNKLIDVLLDGNKIMMFAQDLRSRGVAIES